jgi:hypothetical protein
MNAPSKPDGAMQKNKSARQNFLDASGCARVAAPADVADGLHL